MLEIEEDTQYGLAKEAIVDVIEVNDNIVIPCKSGNGKYFFQRHYYDLLRLSQIYYFNDGIVPAYVYSHIICASKFVMPPTSHNERGNHPTYELPNETLQLIKETLEDRHAMDDDA